MPAKTKRREAPRNQTPRLPPPERVALCIPEVAGLLGLSVRHVWRLVEAGAFPKHYMGTTVRINRADVEAYAASGD